MLSGADFYKVVTAMAPLYVAAMLGYGAVRWLKKFSVDQMSGINTFVSTFSVPVLIFNLVGSSDPYAMAWRLVAADAVQKVIVLAVLAAWAWFHSRRHGGRKATVTCFVLEWTVTAFSVAILSNTVIIGVPLLTAMYGQPAAGLLKEIVVLQFLVWYNIVLFMYEVISAIKQQQCPTPVASEGEVRGSAKQGHEVSINMEDALSKAAEHKTRAPVQDVAAAEMGIHTERSEVDTASPVQDGAPAQEDSPAAQIDAANPQQDVAAAAEIASACPQRDSAPTCEDEVVRSPPAQIKDVPSPSVKYVFRMAAKKILAIPNTYACLLGLTWALVSFRWGFGFPKLVEDSLFAIHTTAVGLSMFSSGAFTARQPKLLAGGFAATSVSVILKFGAGPLAMLISSLIVGLKGQMLRIAVVQASLPLAVTSFVYADEYKIHPAIMSTGVILGMIITLPATLCYYLALERF